MRVAKNDVVQTFPQRFKNSCKNIQDFMQDTKFYQQTEKRYSSVVLQTRSRNQSLIYLFFYRFMVRFESFE